MAFYHTKYSIGVKKKKSKLRRLITYALIVTLLAASFGGYRLYKTFMKPNTWIVEGDSECIYIPTGADYEVLKNLLYEKGIVINRISFEWLAKKKNLSNNVHPGRYRVKQGMNNNQLIGLLRSGDQEPLNLIFNNIRTKQELAGKIGAQIEPDSSQIIKLLQDTSFQKKLGFDNENLISMFIPNTYEVYWNISAEHLIRKMQSEYKKFWTEGRMKKADEKGLSPLEVSIIASIVEKETNKNSEKPQVAAVYLNRLKHNWRLQADPTIVFAWGDFNINRVLNIHKKIDSPYNTYMYEGLPPGPICLPSISSIDAVLNSTDDGYLFFCAKDDFSGFHVFAKTHAQHVVNANKYRRALDERNIKK